MRAILCRTLGESHNLAIEDIMAGNPGAGEVSVTIKAVASTSSTL
jgi:NADPH:quinone reductase-like Zn-dependent oxidoreductase